MTHMKMMILSEKMTHMKMTSLHVLNLETWTTTRTSHHGGQHTGAGMLPHSLLCQIQVLEQQLVNLRWESLLQNRQKTVRLSTNCHSQSQMFNTICNVTCGQKFFSQLNFLQKKSLNGLLITEVWQLRSRIASSSSGGCFTLFSQLPAEVGVASSFSVKINAISQESCSTNARP